MRAGDPHAFAVLMRDNNRRLYRLARGILNDEHEAEDAVQEGYVRAFAHLGSFKGEASLSTWLARIVANEALGRLRRKRPTSDIDALADSLAAEGPGGGAPSAASPEHAAARREIRRAIESAIDALPEPFRIVFVLRVVEQLSIRETAALTGLAEETVKTRLHRANRLLRQALSQEFAAILEDAFPFAGARCDRIVAGVLARLARAGIAFETVGSA
jgi:RNA polymerase sigma-70 factor (ECF subfamily)